MYLRLGSSSGKRVDKLGLFSNVKGISEIRCFDRDLLHKVKITNVSPLGDTLNLSGDALQWVQALLTLGLRVPTEAEFDKLTAAMLS